MDAARLRGLDSIRALAALYVYVYHVWQFSDSPAGRIDIGGASINLLGWVAYGPNAVDVFIVLTGFFMWWSVTGGRTFDTATFYERRIRRVVPAYYAAIAWCTFLPVGSWLLYRALGRDGSFPEFPSLWQYVTHLTFTHTLWPSTWGGIQGSFWTLGLEAQLYLMFPVVFWLWKRYGVGAIVGIMTVSVAYLTTVAVLTAGWPFPDSFLPRITFLGRWIEFGAGILAAMVVRRASTRSLPARVHRWLPAAWAVAAVAFVAAMQSSITGAAPRLPISELLLSASTFAVAIAVCLAPGRLAPVLTRGALPRIGLISYSLYLLHQNTAYYASEFMKKVLDLGGPARFGVLCTVVLAAILALSEIWYRTFEAPFMRSTRVIRSRRVQFA